MIGRSALTLLGLLLLGIPAAYANDVDVQDTNEDICLSIANIWTGSLSDLEKIEETPVPESFRRALESGGCRSWQLDEKGLLDWHLAFGNKGSATSALIYLEQHYSRGELVDDQLVTKLDLAFAKLGSLEDPSSERFRQTAIHARQLVDLGRAYRTVAMEYARAAEFFSDKDLLAKAQSYAGPGIAVEEFLRKRASMDELCRGIEHACLNSARNRQIPKYDDYFDRLAQDLAMRVAVTTARLGGKDTDYAVGRAVLARYEDPNFLIAGDEAYRHGDQFCDIGDSTHLVPWKEVCEADNFDRRALSYWHYRTVLEIWARTNSKPGTQPERSVWDPQVALRLFDVDERERASGIIGARFGKAAGAVSEIRFAIAEAHLVDARRARRGAKADMYSYSYDDALREYWQLALWLPSIDHPGLLKLVGERYLAVASEADTLLKEDADEVRLGVRPDTARRIAYFRSVVPNLDYIKLGKTLPKAEADAPPQAD